MRRYPSYLAYRASGVDWLGDVPAHWAVERLKFVAPESKERLDAKPSDLPYLGLENIESKTGRLLLDVPTEDVASTVVSFRVGDVLFGKLRPYLAKVVRVDFAGVGTTELLVLRPRPGVYGRYLYYYLLTEGFVASINALTYGTKMPRANSEQVGNMRSCLPSLPEQRAIADFLDRETARIDALIAKKQRLIELLQEKRTALISHAVTKGLDAGVAMKESGVAWLGEVPAHWIRTKLKYVVDRIIDTEHKTAPFLPDGEFMVVRTSNIKNGRLITEDAKYTDLDGFKEWTRRGIPHPGDVIFTREAPAGEACVVPPDVPLCVGQRTVLFRVSQHVCDSRFIVYSIYGGLASEFVVVLSQGSTVAHFNMSDIGSIPLFEFSVDEQTAIADFLDAQTDLIDCTLSKIMAGVRQLQEYRTALISAAVTGKIDVRA